MSKFMSALVAIIKKTGYAYQHRGGVLSVGERNINPDLLASASGGLPAVLWQARTFYVDHKIEFLGLEEAVFPDAGALLGYSVDPEKLTPRSSNATQYLLLVSDFLRNECFVELGKDSNYDLVGCDFEGVFQAFRDWASHHVSSPSLAAM